MKIAFAHIIDRNIGDVACSPCLYFKFENYFECDFRNLTIMDGDVLIIGGGGMLHPGVDDFIYEISKVKKVILWAVGLNYHENPEDHIKLLRKKLSKCALVGLRDKNFALENGYEYVPDPTCLHDEFDKPLNPELEIGIYEHYQNPILIDGIRLNNYADKPFHAVIQFLRSFKKIITNSYHGAYWCNLLRIPYEIYNPFSNRFNDIPSDSLHECRRLNMEFHNKVINLC